MDLVITNLTSTNMVQQTSTTTTHATTMVAQEKTQSYVEQAPNNDFIPLAIEMYGCLHFHFHLFLIVCAWTTIMRHQQSSLVPSTFISHYRQHVSIALQHAQAITIFQRATTLGRGSSSLPHMIASAPSSLIDLWQMIAFSF
jgi:hypothetical protein